MFVFVFDLNTIFPTSIRRERGILSPQCSVELCCMTAMTADNYTVVVLQPRYSKTKQCITCQNVKKKKKKDKKRSIFGIKLFVIERVCRHVCKALIRVD